MTDAELEAQLEKLRALRQRTHDGIHHLVNLFTIHTGEMDIAAEAARKAVHRLLTALEEFEAQFPEFKP